MDATLPLEQWRRPRPWAWILTVFVPLPMDWKGIGRGLEGKAGRGALYEGGAYKFALASFPEAVGMTCVDAAVAAIEGEALPEVYESPTTVVSRGEFEEYFVKNGDTWNINFDKLNEL